jgi:hypothetical protein
MVRNHPWLASCVAIAGLLQVAGAERLEEVLQDRGLTVLSAEEGTTGRRSSYHGKSMEHSVYEKLPELAERRVRYGGDETPASGSNYDVGALAYRMEGPKLTLAVVAALSAEKWNESSGALIGQGDLFLAVEQAGSVRHFALLNSMHRGKHVGHGGYYRPAQDFRYGGLAEVGQLVQLKDEEDLTLCGGEYSHQRHENSPKGLDERLFAQGGVVRSKAEIHHDKLKAYAPLKEREASWYLTQWTLPVADLVDSRAPFRMALHFATTCGNDQIEAILEPKKRTGSLY